MAIVIELLARVSEIQKKHELIAEMTGERFNIFSILGLQSAENRTHSAFLRELLDPKGSHGMKDAFLKAFVRMLTKTHGHHKRFKLDGWNEEQQHSAKVETELHIGYKSEDLSQGGRIDLVITPKSGVQRILIENKIYAGDQDCQLVRYRNRDPRAMLLYLTLRGADASDSSTKNQNSGQKLVSGETYFPISYEIHILGWLEECRNEASMRPLVRETIAQYINLIRHLTQQSVSHQMDQELEEIITRSAEDFALSKKIADSYNSIANRTCAALKNRIHSSKNEFVREWKTYKVYSTFGTDGGAYITFYLTDQNNDRCQEHKNPEFAQLVVMLNQMGFIQQNKYNLGWKYCAHINDGNELWRLSRLTEDEAFNELLLERDGHVKSFNAELEKIQSV